MTIIDLDAAPDFILKDGKLIDVRDPQKQWVVDDDGLTGRGYYHIEKSRLLNRRGELYEWPLQVCTKTWVDFEDFNAAFERALVFHRKRYSKRRMAATLTQCRRRIQESADYEAASRELFPEKYDGLFALWSCQEMNVVWDELQRRYAAERAANDNSELCKAA